MIQDTPGTYVEPFDASLLPLPKSVTSASDAFAEALQTAIVVSGDAAVAREALNAARAADAGAARDAVARRKTPPTATATKAEEAAECAQRAVPAAEQLARQAQAEYLVAVADRFDEIMATLDDRQRTLREQASSALEVLAGAMRESIALDDLAREMDLGSITARRPMFRPVRARRRKDPTEAILAPIRTTLAQRTSTGNRIVAGRAA